MLTLNKILKEEFTTQEVEEVKTLLAKHKLDKTLNKTIELIKNTLKDSDLHIKAFGFIQINHIAVSLLIEVNETLRKLDKRKIPDKFSLENNVGRLCSNILSKVIEKQPQKQKIKIVQSLLTALEDVCKFKGYSLKELLYFLRIKAQAAENKSLLKSESALLPSKHEITTFPGFKWNGDNDKLNDFVLLLEKELEICENSSVFKNLFFKPTKNLAIRLNINKVNFILYFFISIKEYGLITFRNCKGFYQVLQMHVIDFDSVFLKNQKPKERLATIKRHKSYSGNDEKFKELFKKFQDK